MKTKAIKNIKVGDYVQSYNHKDDKLVSAKVTEVFKHKDTPGKKIIINNDFIATGNHPIYINDKYRPASEAKVRDIIIGPDGIEVKIHTLTSKPMDIDVYNIEVEGEHNYFAGGILNHNKCGSYKGDDNATSNALASIEDSANVYAGQVGETIRTYYDQIGGLVGPGSQEFETSIDELSGVETTTDTQVQQFSFGSEEAPKLGEKYYSRRTASGGTTEYGGLLDRYETAAGEYDTALNKMASLQIGAEDAMDLAETDTISGLDQASTKISSESEDATKNIEAITAQKGFAATGEETMMKSDIRKQQGTSWESATEAAESSLSSAIADYEKVSGTSESIMVDGVEVADLGSFQTGIETAGRALETAQNDLTYGVSQIESKLSNEASNLRADIGLARTSFSTNTSAQYAVESTGNYIESAGEISDLMEGQVNEFIFGDSSIDYKSAKFGDYGFSPMAGGQMSGESGVSGKKGDTGGGAWHPFASDDSKKSWGWLEFGIGKCLEGNVQVVMGDKNGRN